MARILVIDDTRNIRKMVELALQHDGHHVQSAEDGARGLEAFGQGAGWDLVLVDQQMPNGTGAEVIAEARRRDPNARLLMMTAFATSELAWQVLEAGAVDFLRKPFTTRVLRGAVQAALSASTTSTLESLATAPAQATTPGVPAGATPGVARASWRVNGWSFWPLDGAPRPAEAPASLELGHLFQVRGPAGQVCPCFVGVTPHIREQAGHEAGDDSYWEEVCAQCLLNWLWDRAEAPPAVLPLFEMPRFAPQPGHGPIRWAPFGG